MKKLLKKLGQYLFKTVRSPMFISITVLSIVAILSFVISFLFHTSGHLWLPNVLTSFACGCITGIVLYFFANKRNGIQNRTQLEYTSLKNTQRLALELKFEISYFLKHEVNDVSDEELLEFCSSVLDRFLGVCDESYNIDEHILLQEMGIDCESADQDDWCIFYNNEEKMCTEILKGNYTLESITSYLRQILSKTDDLIHRLKTPIQKRKELLKDLINKVF